MTLLCFHCKVRILRGGRHGSEMSILGYVWNHPLAHLFTTSYMLDTQSFTREIILCHHWQLKRCTVVFTSRKYGAMHKDCFAESSMHVMNSKYQSVYREQFRSFSLFVHQHRQYDPPTWEMCDSWFLLWKSICCNVWQTAIMVASWEAAVAHGPWCQLQCKVES